MKTYFLSVLRPIPDPAGGHVVTVLRVEHPAGLQWMREHADEIAQRAHPRAYNALMIREELPADERIPMAYPVDESAP